MSLISVKTKEGRKAFSAARGGTQIPTDRYVTVERTPWIVRLIEHHGDLLVEPNSPVKPVKTTAPDAPPAV